MKQVERYHEKGYYVLYNPHNKKYFLRMNNGDIEFTPNLLKAYSFGTMEEVFNSHPHLEGFEWREVHMQIVQTLVKEPA